MISPRQAWMSALVALAAAGCSTSRHSEALETELRQQEDLLGEMESELDKVRSELQVARQEAESLRTQLAQQTGHSVLPEQAQVLFAAQSVKFNSTFTGGVNVDSQPGDDALSVVLMPMDADGELVKLPGTIELELLDLTLPESEQRIGRWTFAPEEARSYWRRGFLSSGYVFQLPWERHPAGDELTLHGVLTTPDGRRFDVTTQVKVAVNKTAAAPATLSPTTGLSAASHQLGPADQTPRRPGERGEIRPASASSRSIPRRPLDDTERANSGRPANRLPPLPLPDDSFTAEGDTAPTSRTAPAGVAAASDLRRVAPGTELGGQAEPDATDDMRPPVRTSDAFTEQTIPRYR